MATRTSPTRVLTLFAMANLLSYASRTAPFAVYDDLRARFGLFTIAHLHPLWTTRLDEADLGLLGTIFMLPHALATLPLGWFGDRLDRRKVIAAGAVLWSAAGVVGALAPTYAGVLVSRALVGLGTAAVVPPANAVLGELYAGKHKAFALAVFNLGLFLGGMVGFGLGAALGDRWGWIAIALPGFVLAAALLAIHVPQGVAAGASWRVLAADAWAVVRIRTIRRLMTATTVMAFAAGGMTAWMIQFLQDDKGMTKARATTVFGACALAGLAGVIAGGRVGDRLRRRWAWGRPGAMALGMACGAPCLAAAMLLPDGIPLYAASAAALFFTTWYHGPMASSIDDVAPPALAATAQAVALFMTHLVGTAPSSWVLGQVYHLVGARTAMAVAIAAVALAALLVTRAFGSVAADAAVRDRGVTGSSAGLPRARVVPDR
ncbi:MAG TPA: MFS transporter [Kofleriaceae bacterium]|nr:MFS transporter [Kofleriaceae bacterium]